MMWRKLARIGAHWYPRKSNTCLSNAASWKGEGRVTASELIMFSVKVVMCSLSKSLQQLKMLLHSQSNLLPMNQVSRTKCVSTTPHLPLRTPLMAKLM